MEELDDEFIETLVKRHTDTVVSWLKKDRTIGEAYAEANREAAKSIQAHYEAKIVEKEEAAFLLGYEAGESIANGTAKSQLKAEILKYFDSLEQSIQQHTVPEGKHLVTRSYVLNSIKYERAKLNELFNVEEN